MCDTAIGSKISRNVVTNSKQRCYVVHGTHNVFLTENVCYDHFGHGFLLEDHAERNNVLTYNLVAVSRKATTLVTEDESDGTFYPSSSLHLSVSWDSSSFPFGNIFNPL
jgi:hypothetical protein